jgi:NADH-quinone oxidoreductase subunit G
VDEGWLCDKGRFGYTHLYARDRISDPLRRVRRRGFEELSWDDALDEAERLLRDASGQIVTVLSGSETVEQAYALGRLLRQGLGAHTAMLPEETSPALDTFRLPLSAIRDAELVVILGDQPVAERAPIVDLWIRAAKRNGAQVALAGDAHEACLRLSGSGDELGGRLRASERAILIWSDDEGAGGAHVAALARELGFAGKAGSGAFHLPRTANGRGVADAWAAAHDDEGEAPETIGLLVVSGDEAAADPNVRALAERAERVLVTSMFHGLTACWANLVLPGTSYLERDGTYVNLEGRLQRLRRSAIPPAPDELAWISKLAERFGVELAPHASAVFGELSERIYDGLPFGEVGEHAELRTRSEAPATELPEQPPAPQGKGLRLVRYKPLFSGPAIERVPELQFQRPGAEVELSPADALALGIATGEPVRVSHNGTSVELQARVNGALRSGVVRIAAEHAGELGGNVEVAK